MIVRDDDAQLSQRFTQIRGDEIQRLEIIAGMFGEQNLQAIPNGDARRDDEKIGRKSFVVGTGEFVQTEPGDEHGHDDGFSAARGHFEGEAKQQRIVGVLGFVEELVAEFVSENRRDFDEINGRFERFELAKEEFLFTFFTPPMFEQVFRAAFDVQVSALAPDGDFFPQPIDEDDLFFSLGLDPRKVELFAFFGLRDGDEVAGGAASFEDRVGDAFLGEGEVPRGFGEGGIEDGVGDETASSGNRGSSRHRGLVWGGLSSGRTGVSTTICGVAKMPRDRGILGGKSEDEGGLFGVRKRREPGRRIAAVVGNDLRCVRGGSRMLWQGARRSDGAGHVRRTRDAP